MADSLVGVWSLVAVEFRTASGKLLLPFGPDPAGQLVITKAGHLALQVMDNRRPRFASGDALGSTVQERATAMQGFSAYSGTYRVEGDRLLIHITTSLFPNWVGQVEERTFLFRGKQLLIRTKSVLAGGEEVSADVIWKQVSDLA
jgi:hypothetical protein